MASPRLFWLVVVALIAGVAIGRYLLADEPIRQAYAEGASSGLAYGHLQAACNAHLATEYEREALTPNDRSWMYWASRENRPSDLDAAEELRADKWPQVWSSIESGQAPDGSRGGFFYGTDEPISVLYNPEGLIAEYYDTVLSRSVTSANVAYGLLRDFYRTPGLDDPARSDIVELIEAFLRVDAIRNSPEAEWELTAEEWESNIIEGCFKVSFRTVRAIVFRLDPDS